MNAKTVIFFGRSGSGKGTQAKLLQEFLEKNDSERKVIYVETGQGLRDLASQDYFISKLIQDKLDVGGLFPEFLPIWIWTDFLIKNYNNSEHVIFDGISRRINEAPVIDGALDFFGIKKPFVVHLRTSNEWSKKRLLERGREDDDEFEISNRLAWYDTNVMPVVRWFEDNDKYEFLDINGEQPIDDVHKDIIKLLTEND